MTTPQKETNAPPGPRTLWLVVGVLVGLLAACSGSPESPSTDATPPVDAGPADSPADMAADVARDAPPPRQPGEVCRGPRDCVDGTRCIGHGNAAETYTCMSVCENIGGLCDNGAVCVSVPGAGGVCYAGGDGRAGSDCQTILECRPGLVCAGVDDADLHCLEACHLEDGGCEDDEYCRTFPRSPKGICRARIGAACSPDDPCSPGLSCRTAIGDISLPDGFCTVAPCEGPEDCPEATVCRKPHSAQKGLCFPRCPFDAACRFSKDYACLDADACEASDAPTDCQSFRDGEPFCVPRTLTKW